MKTILKKHTQFQHKFKKNTHFSLSNKITIEGI
jgi:hypothetical protein